MQFGQPVRSLDIFLTSAEGIEPTRKGRGVRKPLKRTKSICLIDRCDTYKVANYKTSWMNDSYFNLNTHYPKNVYTRMY